MSWCRKCPVNYFICYRSCWNKRSYWIPKRCSCSRINCDAIESMVLRYPFRKGDYLPRDCSVRLGSDSHSAKRWCYRIFSNACSESSFGDFHSLSNLFHGENNPDRQCTRSHSWHTDYIPTSLHQCTYYLLAKESKSSSLFKKKVTPRLLFQQLLILTRGKNNYL